MTVAELIAELSKYPPEAEVVTSDSEYGTDSVTGAGVTEVYYHGNGHYVSWPSKRSNTPLETVVKLL